jgi:superfamily I DNA/RNA helicase
MVPLAVRIVESSNIARNAILQTYGHVFLDEFQDCTAGQYQLVKACFHGTRTRLTAVGDTKQRIMGWAGALEGIFETYAQDFDAHPLNLYQNFRSEPRLRRVQNAMVRVMDLPAAVDDGDLLGDGGEIHILRFDNDTDEANGIADAVRNWIESEELEPSEIAVLVSKQQKLYCEKLRAALDERGVPYRDDDADQNLASEPVARLIVDFLLVASGQRHPGPYRRLLDQIVFWRELDPEREYQSRSRWGRFVEGVRTGIAAGNTDLSDLGCLQSVITELLDLVGRETVVGFSPEYAQGDFLQSTIDKTIARAHELMVDAEDPATALASFSGDRAVRIMSIHKSKGLEFDTVLILGVENETFWGDAVAERSAFFVGISRAKRRLCLTVCDERARPTAATSRWNRDRSEQDEFVGYAEGCI